MGAATDGNGKMELKKKTEKQVVQRESKGGNVNERLVISMREMKRNDQPVWTRVLGFVVNWKKRTRRV